MDKDKLMIIYPEASKRQIDMAIKYQDKFQLTYENLKCLNPNCNHIRKDSTVFSKRGFHYTCGNKNCKEITKMEINQFKTEKTINTNINKYKTNYPIQNLEIKTKKKETYFNKTGFENPSQDPKIKEKKKRTYFERTGYEHNMHNPSSKFKFLETMNIKYGIGKIHTNKHILNFSDWDNKEFWVNNFITIDNNFDYFKCIKYFNCKQTAAHNQIKKLNISYIKLKSVSLKEQDIVNYLQNHFQFEVIQNDRQLIKPHELDIYLPELQLAIEYNGSYWHSYHKDNKQNFSPKQADLSYMMYRHQQKSIACLEQGIRLLHLYEDQTEEEQYSLIDKFLINEYDTEATTFSLDNGCYPNNIEVEILEPEARIVCNNRTIWNAGNLIAYKL